MQRERERGGKLDGREAVGHTGSCKPNSSIWIWGSIQLHIHVSLVTILDEEGLAKYFNAPEKKTYYNEKSFGAFFSSVYL